MFFVFILLCSKPLSASPCFVGKEMAQLSFTLSLPAVPRKETSPWKKRVVVKVFIYSFFLVYLLQRFIHVMLGLWPSSGV